MIAWVGGRTSNVVLSSLDLAVDFYDVDWFLDLFVIVAAGK